MKARSKSSRKVTKKPASKKTVTSTTKKKKAAAKPVKKAVTAKKTRRASTRKKVKKSVVKKKAAIPTLKKKTPLNPVEEPAGLNPPTNLPVPAAGPAEPIVTHTPPIPGPESTLDSPASLLIGQVIYYDDPSNVAKIELDAGDLHLGDTIHIKGEITDFEQVVESMEIDHQDVDSAEAGETVDVEVRYAAQEDDNVYKKQE